MSTHSVLFLFANCHSAQSLSASFRPKYTARTRIRRDHADWQQPIGFNWSIHPSRLPSNDRQLWPDSSGKMVMKSIIIRPGRAGPPDHIPYDSNKNSKGPAFSKRNKLSGQLATVKEHSQSTEMHSGKGGSKTLHVKIGYGGPAFFFRPGPMCQFGTQASKAMCQMRILCAKFHMRDNLYHQFFIAPFFAFLW